MSSDIGLIGLAVMGQNLVLNMNDKGWKVSVYNRTVEKLDQFIKGPAKNTSIQGFTTLSEFVASIQRPRKIMLMVKAGAPVDELIEQLIPLIQEGDIIIDGGNSHWNDSTRRYHALKSRNIHYLGVGISGGEEGARHGPSIMPGGDERAWPDIKPIFQSIAARAETGEVCCEWIGSGGAGHFVKMVHNGIEYGDMELIAEAYDVARRGLGKEVEEIAASFDRWNKGVLKSFLIEITAAILKKKEENGRPLVDAILDVAGQKGTGKWTALCALELGLPITLITESVFQRFLSSLFEMRQEASHLFPEEERRAAGSVSFQELESALYAAKIMSYVQGFMLLKEASLAWKWNLDLGACALMWRGGCIIRSVFLGKIKEAYDRNPALPLLAFDPYFQKELLQHLPSLRKVVSFGALSGLPLPCLSSALSFYDSLRSSSLPTSLIQAQRDFFGAHTFERKDTPRGTFFHVDWNI